LKDLLLPDLLRRLHYPSQETPWKINIYLKEGDLMTKMFLGIALIVVALAVITIPMFTDCQSQGKSITLANGAKIPMKCHWSGVAEIVAGVPLGVVGLGMILTKKKTGLNILSSFGVVMGIFIVLIPNSLIGVCTSGMLCETVMKPSLTVLGSVGVVGALGGLLLARKTAP
jgi:hypothetical protein